jgi:HIV Tat-specific factor 1
MSSPEEADALVAACNGRFFGGKRLIAHLHDGITSYKITETEAEKEKRLQMWEKYISDDGPEATNENEKAALAVTPPREAGSDDDLDDDDDD